MLNLLIPFLYMISIIIATLVMLMYVKELRIYKYAIITLMWVYALGKWLIFKSPEIQVVAWITFWDALLFWLLAFSLIVLPFFSIFDKYLQEWEVSKKDKKRLYWLFIMFLIFHSIPEAIQVWYEYTFHSNWHIGWVIKAIIEELPEFILLLGIYIIITNDKRSSLILWIFSWLLFPIVTILVWIFAQTANPVLEMLTKNILLWFYIIFWVMTFNFIMKYNKKYSILYIWLLVILYVYKTAIWT